MPVQTLQSSIDAVLNLLPTSGEMTHAAWREAVLKSGTPNGEEAMRRIFKNRLAGFRLAQKDGDKESVLYVARLS